MNKVIINPKENNVIIEKKSEFIIQQPYAQCPLLRSFPIAVVTN